MKEKSASRENPPRMYHAQRRHRMHHMHKMGACIHGRAAGLSCISPPAEMRRSIRILKPTTIQNSPPVHARRKKSSSDLLLAQKCQIPHTVFAAHLYNHLVCVTLYTQGPLSYNTKNFFQCSILCLFIMQYTHL